MENVQSAEHDLKYLLSKISLYDPVDMLASIAALQLLPENADKSIRFEAFAYAAASLLEENGKKCISINKINFLLNRSSFSEGSIKLMEDPMANPFTESITFLNGSYIVLPWNLEESTFVFRQLIKALFNFTDPFPNSEFIKQAKMLILACLLLSNEIALRAGLKRDMAPISKNEKIYIPDRKTVSKLKTAVSFSLSELETILAKHGIERSILDRLTIVPGSFSASKYQIDKNNLLAKPIVKFKNKIVISIPGMLLPATRNEIILLAKEYGLDEKLAMRYSLAIWGSVIESLGYLDNRIINIPKCSPLEISCGRDAFFALDTDKLIYTIMFTDQLINYNAIFSDWPFDDLSHKIETRLEYIKGYIASLKRPPNDILFLVLIQGIGRRYFLGFGDRAIPLQFPLLGFSAADLETIAILEAGEKLALWKYACSKEIIRKDTFVHRTGELDEFYIYRKNDNSYYLSDKPRPKGLFIAPEGALELRMEVLKKIKSHSVPSYHHGKMEEVIALHEKSNIPLFISKSVINGRSENIALFVENYCLPIWIIGPILEDDFQRKLHKLYAEFAETLGYWLWQFAPMLNPILQCVASKYPQILIRLYLYSDDAWFKSESEIERLHEDPIDIEIDSVNGFIDITLSPTISILLEKKDNSGERYLIRCVINGIRRLLDEGDREELSEEAISVGLDVYAPLGIKKKIFSINEANDPRLNSEGLPHYRILQQWDINKLLDELGDHLVFGERFSIAKIEDAQRTCFLNEKVVDFYYNKLENLIASLRPQGLLEWLVSYHEAIIFTIAEYNLSIPTRKACLSSEPEIVDLLSKDLPQLNNTAMANRFIIEYVTAKPPNGLRPMSYGMYDQIQALANHIINFGFLSDSIKYNISDIKLAILPSMRLGTDREHFEKAHKQYLASFSTGEVERLTQSFGRYWRHNKDSVEKPESIDRIDRATSIEFGHSLTNLLDLIIEAHSIGKKIDPVVACIPRNDLVDKLIDHLEWPREKVNHAVDLLSLNPRPNFLQPSSPYKGVDVYPWRFNRALSYIRRPFLCRNHVDSKEILWGIRNTIDAGLYLTDLCINGRLKASSQEMKKLQGELSEVRGKEFNIRVGKLLERNPALIVKYPLKKFGNRGLVDSKGKDLGDIDVLAINIKNKDLKIIECKDLALARTPYEMGYELKNIFEDENGRSIIERHKRRTDWVKGNLDFILEYFGLGNNTKWKIEPIIVVDQELITPYIRKSPFRVLSISELERGAIK